LISNVTKRFRKRLVRKSGLGRIPALHHGFQAFLTFQFVSLAWILFRAGSPEAAWSYLRRVSLHPPAQGSPVPIFHLLLIGLFIGLEALRRDEAPWSLLRRIPRPVRIIAYGFFLCLIIVLAADTKNEFIYAGF
jgi:hypothetical protein